MRGHHIYASSWFKYGSNSKNPGTYTVELTNNIFGSDTEDVIFKLNQMCASVPEILTPRNTNESVLRIYHVLPDTTVVSRSWFVTDEITGRGTVPYTHSLIYRGHDNERFLQNPAKSFEPGSAEPYKSYLKRVSTDAPTKLSTKYDPREEEYKEPFVFSKNDWIAEFGLDEELFAKYYISLSRAICGKGNSRVAVILRKNMDSEKLILVTLSLLPQFMKRKFAAASKWTGMMDGSGSTAVNGIQLLCYYEETPVSESGFPVIDLTGAGRHANITAPNTTELSYTRWIWQNIDDRKVFSDYENFIESTFFSVLGKIPFKVIADSFFLWLNRNVDNFEIAKISLLLIAGSFAKNFAKFEFIHNTLEKVTCRLLKNVKTSQYDDKKVQAVCVLASNGSASAKKLVDALFDAFRCNEDDQEKNDEYWEKLAIILQYYKSVYETTPKGEPERKTAINNLAACVNLGDKSHECAKIARETVLFCCRTLRETVLTDREKSGEALLEYERKSLCLIEVIKLPVNFFQLKDINKINSIDGERFFELERFDIETLGYIPTIQHWVQAINYAANLTFQRKGELWYLYFSKIRNNKAEYINALEKEEKAIIGGCNLVLDELIDFSEDAASEITEYFKEGFNSDWVSALRPLESDETWMYVKEWLERLHKVQYVEQDVLQVICEKIGLTEETVVILAACLSSESVRTINRLYIHDHSINTMMDSLKKVDSKAEFRECMLLGDILNGSNKSLLINRLKYWYKKVPDPPAEWAFEIASSKSSSGSSLSNNYLKLRLGIVTYSAGNAEVLELFRLMRILCQYVNSDSRRIIIHSVKSRLNNIDKECFKEYQVRSAFKSLVDCTEKKEIGKAIYDILDGDKSVSDDIKNVYYQKKINNYMAYGNDDFWLDRTILIILMILLTVLAGFAEILMFSFCGGNAQIAMVIGKDLALILPYALAALIIISTVFSAVRLLRSGGDG